jgi:hypothetical protein
MKITSERILLTTLTLLAGLIVFAATLDQIGQLMAPYGSAVEPALGLLSALVVVTPLLSRIWRRPFSETALYAAIVGAVACLWTAAGDHVNILTSAQWVLLSGLIAAGSWFSLRRTSIS